MLTVFLQHRNESHLGFVRITGDMGDGPRSLCTVNLKQFVTEISSYTTSEFYCPELYQ